MNFRILTLTFCVGALCSMLHSQNISSLPVTCSNAVLSASDLYNIHINDIEPHHAAPVISTVSGCVNGCTVANSGSNWPAGTWYRGYADVVVPNSTFCAGGVGGGTHPLIRHSEDMGKAYLNAYRNTNYSVYYDRMKGAVQYLADVASTVAGAYRVWYYRPNCTTGNVGEIPGANPTDSYETSRALRMLADGYWMMVNEGDVDAGNYYDAIEAAANNLLSLSTPGTSNYKGFHAWALSAAYKVTGNKKYLIRAKDMGVLLRTANDPTWGVWFTGSTHYACTPALSYSHDTEIWYHLISLRGLIEAYYTLPDIGSLSAVRSPMPAAIDRAVNHIITQRYDQTTQKMTRFFRTGGIPSSCQIMKTYDIEALALLYYYGQSDPHYSAADMANLRNLLNCLQAGATNDEVEYWKVNAMYQNYVDAVGLPYSMNQTGDVDDELLHQFVSGAPMDVFRSEDAMTLSANSIYNGSNFVSNWITGDFDGNGKDELLYSFDGSTTIYLSADPSSLSTSDPQVYAGGAGIDKWIVGDFDGNGKDELFYKFVGSPNLYKSNDNVAITMTGATPVYSGTNILENWIVGDFAGNSYNLNCGDGDAELYFKFAAPATNSTYIYQYDEGTFSLSTIKYNGTSVLKNWVVGEFRASANAERDDLVYQFDGSNDVLVANGGVFPGTSVCSTCTAAIDKWIVGDFDGDLDDELIYKFTSSNSVYNSEDATALAPGSTGVATVYTGAYPVEQWIVSDFNGDRNDEILTKFGTRTKIFRSDDGLNIGGGTPVYQGSQHLRSWIAGNFDGMLNPNKMGTVVQESKPTFALDVYPNPTRRDLHIRFKAEEAGVVQLKVYNIQGQLIWAQEANLGRPGELEFDWAAGIEVSDGLYLLSVSQNETQIVKRIVVEKQ